MGDCLKISPKRIARKIRAHLLIPPSKSHTMRAIMLGGMLKGESTIENFLPSPDTDRLFKSLTALGVTIKHKRADKVTITGRFPWKACDKPFDVGNSGIQLRFLTAFLSLFPHPYQIGGDATLNAMRPAHDLLQGLAQLGAKITYLKEIGKAPFIIQGPIHSGKVRLKGDDSQPVSAILLALALLDKGGEIEVEDPKETPWIEMTLGWLKRLGSKVQVLPDYKHYQIIKGIEKDSFDFAIPSDYSSLAYPFSMAFVTKTPLALSAFPFLQKEGDAAFLQHVEKELGSGFFQDDGKIIPSLDWKWQKDTIDLSDCIDLVSLFAVLATKAPTKIEIHGIEGATKKECNRLNAIACELKKMQGKCYVKREALWIYPSKLKGAKVHSYGDHRMVLALSIAAMMAEGTTYIENADCLVKSYPTYVEAMQGLGFDWSWM